MRYIQSAYRTIGVPVPIIRQSVTIFELVNGSRIISLPDNQRGVRGFHVDELTLDEASQISDELYLSVRPMLLRRRGTLNAPTTPFGKRGWFWGVWDEQPDWHKVKITAEQCGRYTSEQLAKERREMGLRWYSQEYELEFHDAIDAVFTQQDIRAAIVDDLEPLFSGWEN